VCPLMEFARPMTERALGTLTKTLTAFRTQRWVNQGSHPPWVRGAQKIARWIRAGVDVCVCVRECLQTVCVGEVGTGWWNSSRIELRVRSSNT
jgi:hypothetical protein